MSSPQSKTNAVEFEKTSKNQPKLLRLSDATYSFLQLKEVSQRKDIKSLQLDRATLQGNSTKKITVESLNVKAVEDRLKDVDGVDISKIHEGTVQIDLLEFTPFTVPILPIVEKFKGIISKQEMLKLPDRVTFDLTNSSLKKLKIYRLGYVRDSNRICRTIIMDTDKKILADTDGRYRCDRCASAVEHYIQEEGKEEEKMKLDSNKGGKTINFVFKNMKHEAIFIVNNDLKFDLYPSMQLERARGNYCHYCCKRMGGMLAIVPCPKYL